jgi:hypothetical protein
MTGALTGWLGLYPLCNRYLLIRKTVFGLRCFKLEWRRGLSRVPGFLPQVELARASANWYGETRCCLRYSFVHADSLRPLASRTAADFIFAC